MYIIIYVMFKLMSKQRAGEVHSFQVKVLYINNNEYQNS